MLLIYLCRLCAISHILQTSLSHIQRYSNGLKLTLRLLAGFSSNLFTVTSPIFRGETGDMFHIQTGSNLFQGKETVISRVIQKRATILRPRLAFIKAEKVSCHLSSQFFLAMVALCLSTTSNSTHCLSYKPKDQTNLQHSYSHVLQHPMSATLLCALP